MKYPVKIRELENQFMLLLKNNINALLIFFLLLGCTSNQYEINNLNTNIPFLKSSPDFLMSDNFEDNLPKCIAILPIKITDDTIINIFSVDIEEIIRHTVYAHLSPYQYKDIELSKVDYYYNRDKDIKHLANNLDCNNFITGNILRFNQQDLKIYSNLALEIELNLLNADLNENLWTSRYRLDTHGGTIPLSPIGMAFGLADAAKNIESDQYIRIADETVRTMISTLPDNEQLVYSISIEDKESARLNLAKKTNRESIAIKNGELSNEEYKMLLSLNDLSVDQKIDIYEKLIELNPQDLEIRNSYNQYLFDTSRLDSSLNKISLMISQNIYDGETYFLKGRIHLKLNQLDNAESSFIKAAALKDNDTLSLNALGYVYSQKENNFKAAAAYEMVLGRDSDNIYANLNLGILKINSEKYMQALNYLERAAVLSIKNNEYRYYLMAIDKIHALKKHGVDVFSSMELIKKLEENTSWE